MNAPVLVAQLSGAAPQTTTPPKNLKLEKPQNGQAISIHLDGNTRLDFTDIASEKLTFVKVGEKLIVLFDNQSTVTVDPVFDSGGHPLANVAFEVGPDRIVTGDEFASLFPITTDQSVLPAAGNSGPTAGANFSDPHVSALNDPNNPLALLGDENTNSQFNSLNDQVPGSAPIASGADAGSINEDRLPGGNIDGSGSLSVTGSLHIDFGSSAASRDLSFDVAQPGLAGLTSGGQAISLLITTVNGVPTLIGYVGADSGNAANYVFTVSLNAGPIDGEYTFNLLHPLDHAVHGSEDLLGLTINVIGSDTAGQVTTTINISVQDDVPVIVAANETHTTLLDPVSGGIATETGSLGISWGSDRFNDHVNGGTSTGNGDRAVVFADQAVLATGNGEGGATSIAQLTVHGEAVHYVLADNGTTLIAYTGTVVPTGAPADAAAASAAHVVFVVTLSDSGDTGGYSISQYQPLDHDANGQTFSSIDLKFNFIATDSDGDPASGVLSVTIADTNPVSTGAITDTTAVESTQQGGSNGFIAASTSESLHINWNADDANPTAGAGAHDRSVAFTDATISALVAQNLTSNGQSLHYAITTAADGSSVLTASVQTGEGEGTQSRTVFTVTLSDDGSGSYTFNLLDNLDHSTGGGKNDLALTFGNVVATDSDGDIVPVHFTVHVTDDVPLATAPAQAGSIDESHLVAHGEQQGQTQVTFGNLNIDWNADDKNTHLEFASTTVTDGNGHALALTSDGVALDFAVRLAGNGADQELVAYKHGDPLGAENPVFIVSLNAPVNPAYIFTLFQNLDHPGQGADTLSLHFTVNGFDGDGDSVQQTFGVDIKDDVPTAGTVTDSTVVESTQSGESNAFVAASVSESLNVHWNADDANPTAGAGAHDRSVAFTDATVATLVAQGLTSNGQSLHYAITTAADGSSVLTATVQTGEGEGAQSHTVFTVTLSDDGSGSYTFNLLDNLDHANTQGKNDLALTFDNVVATDSDGDTVPVHFTVHVTDDVPLATSPAQVGSIDESHLVAHGEQLGQTQSTFGNLNIDWNADDKNTHLEFASTTITDGNGQPLTLTSDGVALDFAVRQAGNGTDQELVAYKHGDPLGADNPVFIVSLNAPVNPAFIFTLFQNLDHPVQGADTLSLHFTVNGFDGDGDSVQQTFGVDIKDDVPVAGSAVNGVVDEDGGFFTGNPGGNGDVSAGTVALHSLGISWGADNDLKSEPLTNGTIGTVEDPIGRTLSFAAADGGGSALGGTQAFVSGSIVTPEISVTDTASGQTTDVTAALTSDGVGLSYALSYHTDSAGNWDGGYVLLAYKSTGSADHASDQVFRVTIDPTSANGSYKFELLGNLDHPVANTEDNLNLTFGLVAADADGDQIHTAFTVAVNDDTPVTILSIPDGNVEEEQLANGNEDAKGAGDNDLSILGHIVNLTTAHADGLLNVSWGSDSGNSHLDDGFTGTQVNGDRSVVFATGSGQDQTLTDPNQVKAFLSVSDNGQGYDPTTLTSGGVALQYVLSANGTTLTAYAGDPELGHKVFTVSLSDQGLLGTGAYSFDLLGVLDHPVHGTSASQEDALSFKFTFTARDGDGDSTSDHFTVNVSDDSPIAAVGTGSKVEDESLPGGNNETETPNLSASVSHVSLNIAWGADNSNPTEHGGLGDRSVAFTDNHVGVAGAYNGSILTSLGQTVSYAVLSDGQLVGYTGTTAPTSVNSGNVVFYASLSDVNNGEYNFTLVKPLDQSAGHGENSLTLTFNYTATDSDGDTSGNHFTVSVVDDVPLIDSTHVQNGTVEEEQPVVVGAGNEDASGIGDADQRVLGFIYNDRTTEKATGSLGVNWGSDNANDNNGQPGDRSVQFIAGLSAPTGLTSRGEDVHYKVFTVGGEQTLVAYTGAEPTSVPATTQAAIAAHVVFTVALSDVSTHGDYTFTLVDVLDQHQQGEDSLPLTFGYTATDSDGDTTAPGSFTVSVIDDTPIAIGTIAPRFVEEEELSGGNEDTQGAGDGDFSVFGFPVDVTTAHADGLLNILWGGDDSNRNVNGGYNGTQVYGDRSVVFGGAHGDYIADGKVDAALAANFLGVTGGHGDVGLGSLTSGGVAVQYVLSNNGTTLTAFAGDPSLGHKVFTVTLSDQNGGSYDFQLNGVLDHPVHGTSAGQEDTLSFNFTFTARDSDGDIAQNNFIVNVIDDSPVTSGTVAARIVGEDGLPGANLTGGSYDADDHAGLSNVALNVNWGADNDIHTGAGDLVGRTLSFNMAGGVPVDGSGHALALSSDGEVLSYSVVDLVNGGQELHAYKGTDTAANRVFTVTLDPTSDHGSYSFTLNGNLDHAASGTKGNELPLDFGLTATDSDGDTVGTHFTVKVQDDTPTIGTAATTNVNEDDLPNGNDLFKETRTVHGDLAIHWGADDGAAKHILMAANGLPAGLTSDGVAIDYQTTVDADGNAVVVAYKHGGSANSASDQVFSLNFNENGSGTYTFKLLGNLDHDVGSDDRALQFTVNATDSDGDSVAQSFTVHVADDTPIAIGTILTRTVEEEELSGGNEDTQGAGDADFSVFGIPVDVTTGHANGLLNVLWGGDDANRNVDGGYNGTQIFGDRSVVFGGMAGAHIADGTVSAADASAFVSVSGGHGSIGLADLTSGGVALQYVLSGNGTVLTAYAGSVHDAAHAVFTVTLSDQNGGSYDFQLNGALDHPVHGTSASQEDTLSFNFTFTARDGDGDIAQNNFTVNVIDDSPVINAAHIQNGAVDEDALANGNAGDSYPEGSVPAELSGVLPVVHNTLGTAGDINATNQASGTLGVSWGADHGTARTLTFDQSALPTGLKSDGADVHIWVSADGTKLEGYTGALSTTEPSNPVFTVTLDATAPNGAYTFLLQQPLDQPVANQEDSINLKFGFIATDSDGDTASSSFTVAVNDDAPTADYLGLATIQESANADGSFHAVTDAGTLPFHAGADGAIVTNLLYRFSGTPNVVADGDATGFSTTPMTSGGLPVTITQTISGGFITLTGTTSGATIFTFQVNQATGAYTYTQSGPLDHPDHGVNGSETGNADPVVLTFDYIVTDRDGDNATGAINVAINDDGPTATLSKLVTQESANADGSFHVQPVTSHFVFTPGADGAKVTAIHYDFGSKIADGDAPTFTSLPLTSGGQQVTVTESADHLTLTGSLANGDKVFVIQVTNPTTGEYSYTQYAPLDHPDINESGAQDPLRMRISFTVTDGDGDTATNHIQLDVNDDAPTATLSKLVTQESANTDGSFHVQPVTSHFVFTPGADGAKVTAIHYDFGNNIADGDAPTFTSLPLTSSGQQVTVTESADHLTLTGALANGDKVFVVQVTNPATGEYTYTQYAPLDHPDINESGAQDPLRMRISFTVTDGDGDTATNHIQLDVNDDAPTISGNAVQANLLTNGDFAGGTFAHQESWGQWATEDTGWHITGTVAGQTGVQLERVQDGYLGMHSSNGHPMVDLGATPGDIQISQTISGLNSGQHYTLSFEVGSPSPGSAGLEVYWNGNLIHTYAPGSSMSTQTLDLTAGTGANTLSFKEIGNPNDNTGSYLANVSLTAASSAALPVFHADAQENGTQTFHLVSGSDFSFGADGPGSVIFDMAHATIASPTGTTLGMPTLSYDPATGTLTMTPGYAFDGLSQGEIATLSVPFTITDGDGDTKTGVYQFTITGTNDGISTSEGFPDHMTMTEYAENDPRAGSTDDRTVFDAPAGHAGYNGGGFWLYDADQGDTHTISVVPQGTNYLGTLEAVVSEETSGDGVGFVTWHFHVSDAELNQLAEGETRDEVFRVNIDDGHGGTAYRDITVTLVGSEDAPHITVGANDSDHVFLTETNAGLTANGTLTATDVDVSDVMSAHVVAVSAGGAGILDHVSLAQLANLFTVGPNPVDTATTTSGAIHWTFDSGNEAFDFLPKGFESVINYTIEVTDGHGGTDQHVVQIKLHGTNDAPVITIPNGESSSMAIPGFEHEAVVTRSLTETDTHLTTTGTLTVSDADTGDTVTAVVKSVSGGGAGYNAQNAFGFLSVSPSPVIDGSHTSPEALNWSFDTGSQTFDFLPKGFQVRLNYTVEVTDSQGATSDQVISVLITGTNDAPVITIPNGESTSTAIAGFENDTVVTRSLTETDSHLTTSGALTVSDADAGDTVSAVVKSVSGGGAGYNAQNAFGFLTVSPSPVIDGSHTSPETLNWSFDTGSQTFDFLPKGFQVRLNYTVEVTDSQGATSDQVISVLITGTNDAPVITIPNGESTSTTIPGFEHEAVVTRSLTETDTHLTTSGALTVSDADAGDTVSAVVKSVSGGGAGFNAQNALGFLSVSPSPVIDGSHASPETLHWSFDTGSQTFDFLPAGFQVRLNYTVEVTDSQGATSDQVISVLITGTNDAPVITSLSGAASGSVNEAGDLPLIAEAGVGGTLHFSDGLAAQIAGNATVTSALANVLTHPSDVASTIVTVMSELHVNEATALAIVWKTFDGPYLTNPGQLNINQGFTYLGLSYDTYLKNGGSPLLDVVAKYAPDTNSNGTPDRLQSLHDNLLSNVTDYALHQRYDAAGLYQQMHDLVAGQDASLLTRSPQPVTGSESDPTNLASDAHSYDMAHGYATHVSGQLTAHDVDSGDDAHLAWSISGTPVYGTIAIDATGKWTYTLDDTLPATEALGAGETKTETFVATVTDGHGGSASQTVTVTVNGTNDAPTITSAPSAAQASVYEAGVLDHVISADVAADHKFSITPHLNPVAGSPTDPTTADTAAEMKAVVTAVQAGLGSGATFADAIATVWDNLDHNYTNYYVNAVNKASVLLGLVYADYVQHGGAPLTDVIVKYTPDSNADGIAERSQSLHDNLLGALDNPSMIDKFLGAGQGSNPNPDQATYNSLMNQIHAAGLDGRPIYSGNEGADPTATHDFDVAHGLLPSSGQHLSVSGQLTATDVDTNDAGHLLWSADHVNGTYGTFALNNSTGQWTYTLDDTSAATQALSAGETRTESFVATVTDAHGGSASQTVTVTVHGANDAPVLDLSGPSLAGNSVETTAVEQLPQWIVNSATINDVDSPTMASLTATLVSPPDGAQEGLSLNVAALAAVAANPGVSWNYNAATGALTVTGDAATSVYQTILQGIVYLNNSDNPATTDRTIHVVVNDGLTDSGQQTAIVHVWATNDPPQLTGSLHAVMDEGSTHTILPAELGFSDPDDVATGVTFTVSNQVNGLIKLDGVPSLSFTGQQLLDGHVTFVHDGSETTAATFNVYVEDGNEDGSAPVSQTFHIDVTPVNDAPVASPDLVTLADTAGPDAGHVYTGSVSVLANDHDPDVGDTMSVITIRPLSPNPLAFTPVTDGGATAHGTYGDLTIHPDGTYTYTPNAAYDALTASDHVDDVFKYGITDSSGATSTSTLTFHIDGANDAPVASPDLVTLAGHVYNGVVSVLANDHDADTGDTMSVITIRPLLPNPLVFTPVTDAGATAHGTYGDLTIHPDGTYTYTPNAAYDALTASDHVDDVFKYGITDSNGATSTSTLTFHIDGANDTPPNAPPTANGENIIVHQHDASPFTIPVAALLWNDTDPNGDALSITSVSGQHVSLSADHQTVTFQVTGNVGSSADFDYYVSDGVNTVMATAHVTRVDSTPMGTSGADILIDNGAPGVNLYGYGGADVLITNTAGGSNIHADTPYYPDLGDDVARNLLIGSAAPDQLFGGKGNDTLFGGGSADRLYGDAGNDTLTGGLGGDTFSFHEAGAANKDTITDYNRGSGTYDPNEGDKIDLSGLLDGIFNQGSNAGNSTISNYVQIVSQSGTETLQVDLTGGTGPGHATHSWQDVAALTGVSNAEIVNVAFANTDHQIHAA